MPLAARLRQRVLSGWCLNADDTPVRLLDPSYPDGVRTARFWLYRGCDEVPYNVFDFHEIRSRDGPREFLQDFRGWMKVDAYGIHGGVYLGSGGRIRASCCLAHARRKFDEAKSSHPALAAQALGCFQQLYDIKDRAREFSPAARHALRQREVVPLLAQLRAWVDEQTARALPKLKWGEALGYLCNQWEPLTNYVEDGRLSIDNNATERDLRRSRSAARIGCSSAAPQPAHSPLSCTRSWPAPRGTTSTSGPTCATC